MVVPKHVATQARVYIYIHTFFLALQHSMGYGLIGHEVS
jgi:hypothetical protein